MSGTRSPTFQLYLSRRIHADDGAGTVAHPRLLLFFRELRIPDTSAPSSPDRPPCWRGSWMAPDSSRRTSWHASHRSRPRRFESAPRSSSAAAGSATPCGSTSVGPSPATSTPIENAARTAIRAPNRMKAMRIERTREDRPDLSPHQVAPDEREDTSCGHLRHEQTFFEMQCAARARGRVWIVGHHDNRLPVLAIQRLQQVEHFVAGLPVEISGRLVAEQ